MACCMEKGVKLQHFTSLEKISGRVFFENNKIYVGIKIDVVMDGTFFSSSAAALVSLT